MQVASQVLRLRFARLPALLHLPYALCSCSSCIFLSSYLQVFFGSLSGLMFAMFVLVLVLSLACWWGSLGFIWCFWARALRLRWIWYIYFPLSLRCKGAGSFQSLPPKTEKMNSSLPAATTGCGLFRSSI